MTATHRAAKLDLIMKQEGIDAGQLAKMKVSEVFDGYTTYVNEAIGDEYKKAGLRYVWSGITDAEDVVKIVNSPGLSSNNNRFMQGMKRVGASPIRDFETGGSDNVFTRIGVEGTSARFSDSYRGSYYRILIDPKEMERTDWYAYATDSFGTVEESEMIKRK